MKTVRLNDKNLARVTDDAAFNLVKAGNAQYVAKNVWKREVRDVKE